MAKTFVLLVLLAVSLPAIHSFTLKEFDTHTQMESEMEEEGDLLTESTPVRPLLRCKSMATTGPKHWGHAIVYCPEGWQITGGGMQANFGAFERAHPYYNGFMCDNNHGWGSGICFARCCQVPGFSYVSPEAEAAGLKSGAEASADNVKGTELRVPIVKVHSNAPIIKVFTRATNTVSSRSQSILTQWTKAKAQAGYCDKAVSDFTSISNAGTCGGPKNNVMYRFVVKFFPLTRGTWTFYLGANFAGGGAMYLDGKLVADARELPMQFDGKWDLDNTGAVLSSKGRTLEPKKWHTLDVFGFSGPQPLDAPMDMGFTFKPSQGARGNPAFQPVTIRNIENACD